MTNTVHLSVRALVEYAYRSGDIEAGFRSAVSLVEGTRTHQQIQKQYGDQDAKEVYVSAEIPYEDLLFVIDGRCDGLLQSDNGLTVDEIKSFSGQPPVLMEETYPVHWAQAQCYAYVVAKDRELESMRVQLTYVQIDSGESRQFVRTMTFTELEQFIHDMVARYYPYASMKSRHAAKRDASIKELSFPFPSYRAGQRQLAASVYQTITDGRKLFAKAPTGIGKTISTLFPAVKAIGEGLLQRLFYLTARTTTRTAAEEAMVMLREGGLHLHTLTLTAKDKVCFKDEVRCTAEYCEYAQGYYDRVGGALLDILDNETGMTREVIERYARKHRVCPFEFSLDAAYAADAVICDYNYIFDPRVNLKRLFEEQKRHTALLVDEAHNLVDRAREMYSAELRKADFLELQRASKNVRPLVYQSAKAVNNYFIALRKSMEESGGEDVRRDLPEQLLDLLETLTDAAEQRLVTGDSDPLLADVYFGCQHFLRIGKLYDERYVTFAEKERSDVRLKLFCLDPSHLLKQYAKGYRAQILFSATLSPLHYFRDMLGGDEEKDYSVSIPSPFSAEQLDVRIERLSTRYQDRERTMDPVAGLLNDMAGRHQGNILVFFPSYAYMNGVYERFMALWPEEVAEQTDNGMKIRTIVQRPGMSEEDRDSFLAAFATGNKGTLVGFAVMGGIFSEGIDLVGDRLTGVAIVGVGLPQVGPERNIIKNYFDDQGKNGFEYAYVFPGMNKVLQAGGRLIRSEQDRGTLLLIDDRYTQPQYARLLPPDWRQSHFM
ncbi:ATP-dependent DNA helicase [Paenibacillus glycanilyticus]|uniref:ATP-dependent DNA helicase n=1 Tax=Paenibacillus glycanilyticus TaxID=126569 RepID=UPI00203EAAE8|nr:ATP-dependent DNA helicase [Paenibacillus glycanilyticus]MCM3628266.1 ATP-dependent DNA helicase [Paenibacillus glycanilyticus]